MKTGNFSEKALSAYAQLIAGSKGVDFAEGGVYDFARCVRPDGTAYGTKGKCRKGTEQAKEEVAPTPKKVAKADKPVKTSTKKVKQEAAPKASKADPKEAYATLMKKQQKLVQKGDIAGAMKLNDKIKAAAEKAKNSPEAKAAEAKLKKEVEAKTDEEKAFEKAQTRREAGQIAAGLSAKDKKVISDYTKETGGQSPRSYDNMNGCLRFPPSCPDPKVSKKFVKEFDAALDKLPKNESGEKFYRGIQVTPGQTEQLYKALEKATPGLRMKDPGYGSYSAERKQAEHFTSRNRPNIIFVTRSKSITPINVYSEVRSENEAILPRGTEQTIRKVTKEGKNLIVELD
jgi:hypothetical protein